jgi:hypothetical protein
MIGTPANVHKTAVVPELVAGTQGLLVGDCNYWNPALKTELAQGALQLEAPFRKASSDPWPKGSALLSRVRYRIDTTFGQLVDRYQVKRVWPRIGGISTAAFRVRCSAILWLCFSIKLKVIRQCSWHG